MFPLVKIQKYKLNLSYMTIKFHKANFIQRGISNFIFLTCLSLPFLLLNPSQFCGHLSLLCNKYILPILQPPTQCCPCIVCKQSF